MSPADPAVAGVRDAGEGFPLLPAAGLHPRGLHSPPRTGESRQRSNSCNASDV